MILSVNNKRKELTIISALLIFILLVIAFLVFQGGKIGGKDSVTTSYPLSYLQERLKDAQGHDNPVRINGDLTGIAVDTNIGYQQETVKIPSDIDCNADQGFEQLYIPDFNMPSFRMYLVNREKQGEEKFNEYYTRFANQTYVSSDNNQLILHPFCGFSDQPQIDSYISDRINIKNNINIAMGGYQSIPMEDENTVISAAIFAYTQDNLVQINFSFNNLFKFNETANFSICRLGEEGSPSNNLIDIDCYAKVLKNDSEKMTLLKNEVNKILEKINLQFY